MPTVSVIRPSGGRLALVLLGCALLAAGPASTRASAQNRDRTLFVSAVDPKGAPVADLQPRDVTVREDGMAREVLRVSPSTDPLQIALLVDNSQAAQPHISDLRKALKAFLAKFSAPNEIAFVTFGERPTIVTEYTSSPDQLTKGVDRLFAQPGSGAYVLDAINDAARGLQKRDAGHPVIVVVSLEGVEFSNRHYDTVLDAMKAAGASLYALTVNEASSAAASRNEEIRNREIVYDRGTRESGGRHEILLTSMSLEDALTRLADELLHQYKVVYSRPTTLIPPEKVTIESSRPNVTVRGVAARAAKP